MEVQILSRALIAVQVVSFLEIALIIDGCGMEYGETKTLVHPEIDACCLVGDYPRPLLAVGTKMRASNSIG